MILKIWTITSDIHTQCTIELDIGYLTHWIKKIKNDVRTSIKVIKMDVHVRYSDVKHWNYANKTI